jgi:hypothetical protein
MGNGYTTFRGVVLPKNLSRAGHLAIAIGFNSVLFLQQSKQAQPGVQPVVPQSLMGVNEM